MFRKIKNIFGYIWAILHNFLSKSIEVQATYALPSEAQKQKIPPLLTWFRPIE